MENKKFLEILAQKLIEKYNYNFSNILIILPNKRAIVFLLDALKKESKQVFFAPKIISIQDYLQEVSELNLIDNITLLFELYNVYCEIQENKNLQTFLEFSNWGKTAITDFNEIDNYLIEAKTILEYLKDVERIKRWELNPENSSKPQDFLKFWELLPEYYQKLKSNLFEKKLGYNGLINRIASENIEKYSKINNQIEYLFAGFNALNKCEEKIIKYLLKENKATLFWDSDETILNDPYHHAGLHLREIKNNWSYYKSQPFEWIFNHFKNQKNIEIIATSQNIGQTKIVGNILNLMINDKVNLSNTAVILGNEELLLPLLNELPSELNQLNITMGYKCELTSLHHLIINIFNLHLNSLKRNQKNPVFYYKEVLAILSDFNVSELINDNSFEKNIHQNNYTFFGLKTLNSLSDNQNEILNLIFGLKNDNIVENFIEITIQLIQKIKYSIETKVEIDVVNLTFLHTIHQSILQLKQYTQKHQTISTLDELFVFYKEIIGFSEVSFEGKPLTGLQIMGMLESRLLDFENLIITSVNEGFIPAGKTNNSFIPIDIKRENGLPTFKEKDALISYHFYRLISRAKNIYFIYNDNSTGINVGEKSRFLSQLEINKQKNHQIITKQYFAQIPLKQKSNFYLEKDLFVLEKLHELAKSGFSPSSLNSYIRSQEQFYLQYVLQIRQFDEVEENIAANTFGTIIHQVLENLYRPYINIYLTIEIINKFIENVENEIEKVFAEIYKKGELKKGRNLIAMEVAKQYLKKFLEIEKKSLEHDTLKIISLENKYECKIKDSRLPFPVILKGKIDRIELRNSKIRIIDFKTGSVTAGDLKFSTFDNLTKKIKNDKIIQLLSYLLMTQNEADFKNYEIETGIIAFKSLNGGFLPLEYKIDKIEYTNFSKELLENFKQELITLILEIFDPSIPFSQKETYN